MRRRTFLTLAGTTAGALLTAPPALAAPGSRDSRDSRGLRIDIYPPSGPRPVGRTDHMLVDPGRSDPWVPSRRRRLMVTVWYPAAVPAGPRAPYVGPRLAAQLDTAVTPALGLRAGQLDWAGFDAHAVADVPAAPHAGDRPVVLYSPGAGESRTQGSGVAADLASHGYLVVTIDHTYETAVEFPDGLVQPQVDLTGQATPERLETIIRVRVDDTRFVLDRLAELVGAGIGTIGMVGHSGGGDTALAAAFEDRRLAAVAELDGFAAYDSQGEHPMPASVHGLDRPLLLMGSRSAVDRLPAPGEEPRWTLRSHRQNPAWRVLWETSTGPRYDVGVPAGRHHVFTDHVPILDGAAPLGVPAETVEGFIGALPDRRRAATSVRACVRAFFDRHLRGLPVPLPTGPDLTSVP